MNRVRKKSTFTARDPNFSAKLEFSEAQLQREGGQDVYAVPGEAAEAEHTPDLATQKASAGRETTGKPASTNREERTANTKQQSDVPPPNPVREANSKSSNSSEEGTTEIRLVITWPEELVSRATVWAEKARCPPRVILKNGWTTARAGLIEELQKGVKYTDIPQERIKGSSERLYARITVSAAAFGRLQAELDPEQVAGISAPLSKWALKKAIPLVDAHLRAAGY